MTGEREGLRHMYGDDLDDPAPEEQSLRAEVPHHVSTEEQLDRAAEDKHVKAVLLRVDSPGGEVLASDEIYRAIHEFQDKTGRPVVAQMGSLAASGGYYVSAPCRWIVANELSLTGSIGVIMSGMNFRGLMDKVGIQPQVYKSGKFKDMMSSTRRPEDIPAGEREMVQGLIDETYATFKGVVRKGRAASRAARTTTSRAERSKAPTATGTRGLMIPAFSRAMAAMVSERRFKVSGFGFQVSVIRDLHTND